MNEKYLSDFINNLAVLKDVQSKSELIKAEIQKLDKMISDDSEYNELTILERLNKRLNYSELLTYKSYLSLKLSFLDSDNA